MFSSQEEADTRITLHCMYVSHQPSNTIILRSPDSAVFVLLLCFSDAINKTLICSAKNVYVTTVWSLLCLFLWQKDSCEAIFSPYWLILQREKVTYLKRNEPLRIIDRSLCVNCIFSFKIFVHVSRNDFTTRSYMWCKSSLQTMLQQVCLMLWLL